MAEILGANFDGEIKWIVIICAVVLGIIEKSDIKQNPYSKLLQIIGRGINSELISKISIMETNLGNLNTEINGLKKELKETTIVNCRTQFTRFADEMRHGEGHSKDHYDQTMLNISKYEQYCQQHPEFANNVTQATAQLIKEDYRKRLETNDFLE